MDIERLLLLRKSIKRFYQGLAAHVVAVPKQDVVLFKSYFDGDDIVILTQNDFVERCFYASRWYTFVSRVAPGQAWRFSSHVGRPGWVIQQIVKLSIPEMIPIGPVVVLDSDIVFLRKFDDSDLGVSGNKRVLTRIEPESETAKQRMHIEKSRQILGLPPGSTDHHYMSWPAILYPDWVSAMRRHLEKINRKPWQKVLYEAGSISEYSLYGIFLEEVLKPENLLINKEPFNFIIWDRASFEDLIYKRFSLEEKYLCITVQSNLGVPVGEYVNAVKSLWGESA
jgi:hypothetical protein